MSAGSGPLPKRRCVSTACLACRRRKSKCDGNTPSCATCSSIYQTPCVYDPKSDNRRKGVSRKNADALRIWNTTSQSLINAILDCDDDRDAFELVRQIRTHESLEDLADLVVARGKGLAPAAEGAQASSRGQDTEQPSQFESELAGKMNDLLLNGSHKFIGGTSNLIFLPTGSELYEPTSIPEDPSVDATAARWTGVTSDDSLVDHLMTLYFTWHYPIFSILEKEMFCRDYARGISSAYCSSLLVNAILAVGCHFSSWQGAFEDPQDPASAGNHFFKEAKRLAIKYDEHENAKLCTVQAFALMSVREAGCGREGNGWVYSGLSFRIASDLGLDMDVSRCNTQDLSEEEVNARRITFWGCYLIDNCWSNYLGRQPQLSSPSTNVRKFDISSKDETELWSPYTDSGVDHNRTQPSRTRIVASHMLKLSEISNDILMSFYHPADLEKPTTKLVGLKKFRDVRIRLEAWRKDLHAGLEPKEGQLPQVVVMHMFYQLLLIHLYRPFMKFTKSGIPVAPQVSPRKMCTLAASTISELLQIYRRTYGLKQVCNIVVYIAHTACTIHLLNLPDDNAQRDVVCILRDLEEMANHWPCARRTLCILHASASKWQISLSSESEAIFERTHTKWGSWGPWDKATTSPTSVDSTVTHSSLQSLITSSSQPSPSGSHLATAPPTVSLTTVPVTAVGESTQPECPTTSARIYSPKYRALGAELQPSEFMPPEPTYLQPLSSQVSSSYLYSLPSSSFDLNTQYDASGTQSQPQQTTVNMGTPDVASFDFTENLVEESREWWFRDAAMLNIGIENWTQDWSSDIVRQSSQSQRSLVEQQPHTAVGLPSSVVSTAYSNNTGGYNNRFTS